MTRTLSDAARSTTAQYAMRKLVYALVLADIDGWGKVARTAQVRVE